MRRRLTLAAAGVALGLLGAIVWSMTPQSLPVSKTPGATLPPLSTKLARIAVVETATIDSRALGALPDGALQQIERSLGARHAGTFAAVRAHSPREDVIAAAAMARRVDADLLVGVGGGSVETHGPQRLGEQAEPVQT